MPVQIFLLDFQNDEEQNASIYGIEAKKTFGDDQQQLRWKNFKQMSGKEMLKHLKDKAPPLLFCVGNPALLNGGGIAVVGSRNVDNAGEMFTRQVARQCVMDGMPVVSGGLSPWGCPIDAFPYRRVWGFGHPEPAEVDRRLSTTVL